MVTLAPKRGADINARDRYRRTPLHIDCTRGHAAVFALLIENGCGYELRDTDGHNACWLAVMNNDVVRVFYDCGLEFDT
jgi:ankyrin repeat protein